MSLRYFQVHAACLVSCCMSRSALNVFVHVSETKRLKLNLYTLAVRQIDKQAGRLKDRKTKRYE
jgi:hypothetical protein